MCGRFELKADKEYLERIFQKGRKRLNPEIDPNFVMNKESKPGSFGIAPTDNIFNITEMSNDEYKLKISKWGIKFMDNSPLIFNSRIETITEKSYWRDLFINAKCIIPMTAFYEWIPASQPGMKKIPQRIFLPDEEIFFAPAIYIVDKNEICSSLITTSPNKFMKNVHNRMPVILKFDEALEFLHNDYFSNLNICKPYSDEKIMRMEQVN